MARSRRRVAVVFGTRPEAIKLAPVILALRKRADLDVSVCVTGQHRQMVDQILPVFGIRPDADLNLMTANQTLSGLTARLVESLDRYYLDEMPDFVLVQGDTTTVFAASLAAFYHHIPVGHVEAGLRTGDLEAPWPEEANRVLTTRLASLHFAPTDNARNNLLREGIDPGRVFVTGNTVIDALLLAMKRVEAAPPAIDGVTDSGWFHGTSRMVLVTGHRRESFGEGFRHICNAIVRLSEDDPDVHFVYPVHLNPNVQKPVLDIVGRNRANVHLIAPQPYLEFLALMNRAHLVLTDSGGVQEEAPTLGKPVLVMRDVTERPEAVAAGTSRLVGTDEDAIVSGVERLLSDEAEYASMARAANPYGDGLASGRIADAVEAHLLEGTERRG